MNEPAVVATSAPGAALVDAPDPDPDWHPIAARWFVSLGESGQSVFYEPSDWATAAVLAESISRELSDQPMTVGVGKDAYIELVKLAPKAATLAAFLKGSTALMATEGDRRRLAIELQRAKPEAKDGGGDVSQIDEARRRLHGAN